MRLYNVHDGGLEGAQDRPGYSWRAERVGDRIGGSLLGATVYELPPGEKTFPYHFHYGVEEWLFVLDGTPTLRTPDGEGELRRGDVVCFPEGPAGAHAVANRSGETVRVLILSTKDSPSISMYPDSDKIGARPGVPDNTLNFLRGDAVDYWDGE